MTESQPQQGFVPATFEVAITNAQRLLEAAEVETNLPLMERLEHLADSWVNIATLMAQRDRDV